MELLIRKISRNYEIKKQVIGEDADLEKSGRILNRVIELGGDGFTVEADQRHVREILKGLEVERANHTATPCAVESKNEGNARTDERKGENRREQGQFQTKHEWDDVSEGDDRYRPQMADETAMTARHSQAVTSRGTEHSSHGSATCLKTDQTSSSLRCKCAAQVAKPALLRDMERVKRIGRYLAGKPRARCWASWRCTQTLTGEATRLPVGQCRLGSS